MDGSQDPRIPGNLNQPPGSYGRVYPQITGEQLKALEQLQKEGKLPEDPWRSKTTSDLLGDGGFILT